MGVMYCLMDQYVRKYRLKLIEPHRPLADKLFKHANTKEEIDEARKKVLEAFPDAAIKTSIP